MTGPAIQDIRNDRQGTLLRSSNSLTVHFDYYHCSVGIDNAGLVWAHVVLYCRMRHQIGYWQIK